jgi:hypothetical protein
MEGEGGGDSCLNLGVHYFDLKTGKYKSDYFDRFLTINTGFSMFSFEVDSRKYEFNIYSFEAEEEEAAEINESLIFNLFREPSAPSTPIFEDNGLAIGRIGLYIKHNRKAEEERKKRKRAGLVKRLRRSNLKAIN